MRPKQLAAMPDGDINHSFVSIRKLRMRNWQFPDWKAGIFCPGKEIEVLRGGVRLYAAQARPKIDAARAKRHPFRTKLTELLIFTGAPIKVNLFLLSTNLTENGF